MPTYYIHSYYGGRNQSLTASQVAWLESTPNTFVNFHLKDDFSSYLGFGRSMYQSNFETFIGDRFRISSLTYLVQSSGTTSFNMRAKIFSGNIASGNIYPFESYSAVLSVNNNQSKKTFDGFSKTDFVNGNYMFGIWVNTSSTNTGCFLGVEDGSNSIVRESRGVANDAGFDEDFREDSSTYTNFNSKNIYGELVYLTPPDAPFVSSTFDQSGTVTVTWTAPDNGGAAITNYPYRWKNSSSSTWNTGTATTTNPSFTIAGSFGSSYEIEVSARNSVTGTSNIGGIGYDYITVINNDFSIPTKTWTTAVVGTPYTDSITVSTNNQPAIISTAWVDSNGNTVSGPPGLGISTNGNTITVAGTPTLMGNHLLKITLSAVGQTTATRTFNFKVIPRINIFTGIAGSEWQTAKTIQVFNGSSWVDINTIKVFNGQTWVDPR